MNSLNNFLYHLLTTKEDKRYFIENLNLLLTTGISPKEAFISIHKSEKNAGMKFFLEKMIYDADSGISLSQTIANSKIFPVYTVNLIDIGEKTGTLKETLNLLTAEQSKSDMFRSKVKSAMLYPAIVFFFSLVVSVVIAWFMLPRLSSIFNSLHTELPIITKAVVYLGTFLGKYGLIVVPLFIFLIFLITYILFISESTKKYGQTFLYKLPGVGKLLIETEIARLGYLLGSLFEVGVPLKTSVLTMKEASPLYEYKTFYGFLAESLGEGKSFEESFNEYKDCSEIIPTPVQTLIISGEKTGRLAEVLKTLGENYSQKTELSAKNLSVVLEPLFLILVWFVVVGIALAVILPIYSIIGSVSN